MKFAEGLNNYKIKINGIEISFSCRFIPSSEEMILFLHGLGCSKESFRNVFDKHYFNNKTLLFVDLPGFGESSKTESFSYSMENCAEIIEGVVSLLPEMKIHIAAHSMGGAVGLLFSDKFFEKVISFANIEGNLISEDCGLLSRGIISSCYENYKNSLYISQVKEFAGHDQLKFGSTTPFVLYKCAESLVKWSDSGKLLAKFRSLKCRKCYFYGRLNSGMPVLKKLEGIESVMIEECGHAMMTENPDGFYRKLEQFINFE